MIPYNLNCNLFVPTNKIDIFTENVAVIYTKRRQKNKKITNILFRNQGSAKIVILVRSPEKYKLKSNQHLYQMHKKNLKSINAGYR